MKKKLITTSLIAALFAVPAMAEGKNPSLPTTQEATDQKTVTSKYYVDTTKQDKIRTDKVLVFDNDGTEDDVYVPAIVATNAAGTELNGDSVGLVGIENVPGSYSGIGDLEGRDDLVPTIGLVANEFDVLYDEIDASLNMRQEKMTCAGYVPGHEGNLDYCWLYGEVQVACKQGNESCEYHGECCSNMCTGPDGNKTCSFNI